MISKLLARASELLWLLSWRIRPVEEKKATIYLRDLVSAERQEWPAQSVSGLHKMRKWYKDQQVDAAEWEAAQKEKP